MTLQEIKDKICDIRFEIENLSDECNNIWRETDNDNIGEIADYLSDALSEVAYKLSDLEDTNVEVAVLEESEEEDAETIADWWADLDLQDKCNLANIPYPTTNYGRGDEYFYAEERANKWWDSRTYEQKKEIYKENLAWWDKE